MTVFYNRCHDSYVELSGDPIDYVTGISGQNNKSIYGYSGGYMPPMAAVNEQYPIDQTISVTNVR